MSSTDTHDSSGSALARGVGRFAARLFTPRISMKQMTLITSQWAMLYKSGVPMQRCFAVMAEQTRQRVAKHTLIRVADSIEQALRTVHGAGDQRMIVRVCGDMPAGDIKQKQQPCQNLWIKIESVLFCRFNCHRVSP